MKRITAVVREENIQEPVLVQINKAQTRVPAFGVHDSSCWRQAVPGRFPHVFGIGPRQNAGLTLVADDQFALPIIVKVAEANTAVAPIIRRHDEPTTDFESAGEIVLSNLISAFENVSSGSLSANFSRDRTRFTADQH